MSEQTKPVRIMFVCSGNICRSPLAHRMLEKQAQERGVASLIEVESSGTDSYHVGDEADRRMRGTARNHGWTFSHRARQFQTEDLKRYDLVFAMDRGHLREISRRGQSNDGWRARVHLFREFDPDASGPENTAGRDVPDPYYGGPQGFEEVYRIVERTCGVILDALEAGTLP